MTLPSRAMRVTSRFLVKIRMGTERRFRSQISSSNGEISIEGRSGGENGNGLAFLSSSGHLSQVSNTGSIIKLAGKGEGSGKAIVFNDPAGSHSSNDFLINGGFQTDIELDLSGMWCFLI